MCGIAGVFNLNNKPASRSLIKQMTDSIAHRGPDGEGFYVNGPIGLGHRRLAILDLTAAGAQPMNSGSLWISYNGEVYNFPELKKQLEKTGHRFLSQTDTEVVLKSFQEWGNQAVEKFNGMFALAVWDEISQELTLARDRYGIKPLYYYQDQNHFIFASEIKAILQDPTVPRQVCPEALKEYFTFQNIFSDRTLLENIRTLPPGHILKLKNGKIEMKQYWDFEFNPKNISLKEATETLRHKLEAAVKSQLVSDVPLGSYLGGGMDTGTIIAFAAKHYGNRFKTFTIGFDLSLASDPMEQLFDEREYAELVADKFATETYQLIIRPGDLEKTLPKLTYHVDDLRVGMSYNNYYAAELASRFVKVVFDGTGGDEIFGGYPWRYNLLLSQGTGVYCRYWQRLIKEENQKHFFREELLKKTHYHCPEELFNNINQNKTGLNAAFYFELKTFLHGLLLVLDKINMAHSLESRVPLLDNELVDFTLTLPPDYKIDIKQITNNNQFQSLGGKKILRQAMFGILPDRITKREKHGFSVPDASWYRTRTRPYIKNILDNQTNKIYQYLRQDFVSQILNEHFSGKANHRLLIWSLLSFSWWHKIFIENEMDF